MALSEHERERRHLINKERTRVVLEMHDLGMSPEEIAKRLRREVGAVRWTLSQEGRDPHKG